ncbi:MAG: hypothetical protein Q8867_11080, partial [Bacteroidota bacterium]|nr:hypothetical protein [Bacteroidota bacterium]
GPSRTGEELAFAIQKAMNQANVDPAHLDFISSHGTATAYNDEMESKAFAISGVSATPMNSFKGYFGHTLGAAGLIESALTIRSMKENLLIACIGFREPGVPMPVNVIRTHTPARINAALKTVSGFGGCNTALVFKKSTKDTGK